MRKLIDLQPAYLLHSRPFKDTSLLLDFLTRDYGRVSAIANGARRPKSRSRSLLQPFIPLQISLSGKNELKTFRGAELLSEPTILKSSYLFGAMYINEVVVRLIQGQEVEPSVFTEYEQVLLNLSKEKELEPALRKFEFNLLNALGYGIEFSYEADTGEKIEKNAYYYFQHENGFVCFHEHQKEVTLEHYLGQDLLNIADNDYSTVQTKTVAKRIARKLLKQHLGDKPLKSRQLFTAQY